MWEGVVGEVGIGHEVYFYACVILASYTEDCGNLVLLERNTPLKFWLSVSRMISAIVVNLLDTIIN